MFELRAVFVRFFYLAVWTFKLFIQMSFLKILFGPFLKSIELPPRRRIMFSSSPSATDEPVTVAERVRRQRTAKKIKAKAPVTKNADKRSAAGEGSAKTVRHI